MRSHSCCTCHCQHFVVVMTIMIIRWRHNLMIDSMNANVNVIARGGFLLPFTSLLLFIVGLWWHKSKHLRKSSSNVGDVVGGVTKKASEKYANSRSIAIQLEAISARARIQSVCVWYRYSLRGSARDTADWHAIDYIVRAQLRQDAMRYVALRCDEMSSDEKGRDAVETGEWNGGLHDLPCTATAASHLRRKSISLDGQLQGNGPLNSFIIIRRQAHTAGWGYSVSLSLCSARDRVLV